MSRSLEIPRYNAIEAPQDRSGVLTILAGPTASGKSRVLEGVMNKYPQMKKVISSTTRQPGVGEVDGVDYHFLSADDFHEKVSRGGFLETAMYGGNYYGTQKNDIEQVLSGQDVIWIVNMARAIEIEDYYHSEFDPQKAALLAQKTLLVLVGTENLFQLRERFRQRGSSDHFESRIREDWTVWKENAEKFPHVVMNRDGELENTVRDITYLIESKRERRPDRSITNLR